MQLSAIRNPRYLTIFFSFVALVAEFSIIPLVRIFPAATSFWILWILLAVTIVSALIGTLIGAQAFRAERSKTALAGFLLGELALGLIVLYGIVQWLIYL